MTPAVFAIPGDIATRTGGYIYERRLLESLRAQGREVRHLELPSSFPDPTPADMAAALALLAQVPEGTPLILDGFLSGALDSEGLAGLRAPLCAVVHHPVGLETGLSRERAEFLLHREAANLALVRHVLVPSPHTAQVLRARFGVPEGRITVAPPGFDAAAGPPRPVRPPLILSVGILHPRKGHDILLEALARLVDLDWQAAIVGGDHDAAHSAALRAQVARLGLQQRVRFTGEVEDAALSDLYRSATVFALATRYEGYGMVFGEALRHGLPIVSCRTGAVPETVPPAAALLPPADDACAFSDALRQVLEQAPLRDRLAAAARRAGDELPRWDDTAAVANVVLNRLRGETAA